MRQDTWREAWIRWLKFNAVGGIGIAVQLSTLVLLKSGLNLHYLAATALAVEAAVIHNFLWHERFTWADRQEHRSLLRFLKFNFTTGAISILGNVLLMKLLAGTAHLPYLLANLLTIALCAAANFLVSDRFVFAGRTSGNFGIGHRSS